MAFLPPEEFDTRAENQRRPVTSETISRVRLERQLRDTYERLRLLEARDSLLETLLQSDPLPAGSPALISGPNVPASITPLLRESLGEVWRDLSLGSEVTVAVAVLVDTVSPVSGFSGRIWGWRQHAYLLPAFNKMPVCIAAYLPWGPLLDRAQDGEITKSGLPRESLLGICGFYAAFGLPGEGIRRWLELHNYSIGRELAWTDRSWRVASSARTTESWYMSQLYYWYQDLHGCAQGDVGRCRSAVFPAKKRLLRYSDNARLAGVVRQRRWGWWTRSSLGPNRGYFLSDLVHAKGKDRFAEFWRSELPLDRAFEQAFGVSIEEWTMQWARDQIGERDIGPMPSGKAAASSLLLGFLLVGASAMFARRRSVG